MFYSFMGLEEDSAVSVAFSFRGMLRKREGCDTFSHEYKSKSQRRTKSNGKFLLQINLNKFLFTIRLIKLIQFELTI